MRSPAQQRALDRHAAWAARYADKLAGFHPAVRAEVESATRQRFLEGDFSPMPAETLRHCTMRVVSRARIAKGPAGADASGEQLREVLADLERVT